MTTHNRIKIADGYRLQYEKAQEGYVLLFPEGVVQLNGPSAEILKLCDGNYSQEEIIVMLQEKFPQAEVEQDIKEFIQVATEKGWICVQ